ncbi:hypothetical protein QTH87_03245 [Variovorax sp. J22P168]|uniref:hypothetical protein n=1 Tax=Variovorax jilinensis TaxID=3053513 RepID=UPI0025764FC0|nr:hypothetical protein [Variovorax sp. J22P168]MDM0011447.1 hypothetical protein [Variovorax sp. J22P168]
MSGTTVSWFTAPRGGTDPRPARLWLKIFAAGFVLIVGLLIVTLRTPPFFGDMTRIGLLSENAFGWTIEPPQVPDQYLAAVPVSEADVLVIGDSFSMSNRWQSELVRSGLRVTTIFWGQIAEALCGDFDAWLDKAGFKGKTVVIESVERLLAERLANSQNCKKMQKPFTAGTKPFFAPLDHVPPPAVNWDGKLTSGLNIYRNTERARKATGDFLSNKRILVRPVADGCSMFSSRLCDRAPFWPADDENGELTPQHVAQMRAIGEAHPKRSLVWMVIPNKTTVYVKPEHSKDFVTALGASGLGPDLFGFSQEQKKQVRDYYFPNDTHLSMHGQLAVGKRMLEAVRKTQPAPPSKDS